MKKIIMLLACIPVVLGLCSVGSNPIYDYPIAPPDEIVAEQSLSFEEEVALYSRYLAYDSTLMSIDEAEGKLIARYTGDANVVDCLVVLEEGINRWSGEKAVGAYITFILGDEKNASNQVKEDFTAELGSVDELFCVEYVTYTPPVREGNVTYGGHGHYDLLWLSESCE